MARRRGGLPLNNLAYSDQLGAPRVITDAAGSQVWAWDGDPFGNKTPTGMLTFNQRFPGQYPEDYFFCSERGKALTGCCPDAAA